MSKPTILLVGSGGHARACIDVIEREDRFTVSGLVGSQEEVGQQMFGYSVLGTDADLPRLLAAHGNAFVALGQIKSAAPRIRIFELLEQNAALLPSIVSPRAYVSPRAVLGAGSIVMHGATINAGAVVGRNCIINSHALVEHDVAIADHCHISTGAVLNGGVRVGSATFIGSNSAVRQQISIGARCVIGMGQRVLKDCVDDSWLPAPARPT